MDQFEFPGEDYMYAVQPNEDSSDSESPFDFAKIGGYEYEFVDQVSASQECPVCKLPMKDAVQTRECGHRFCRGCLEQTLR